MATKRKRRPLKDRSIPLSVKATMPTVDTPDLGLLAAIQRLREAEVAASRRYLEAVETGTDVGIGRALKAWKDLVEQLRKLELSSPEVLRLNHEVAPVSEFRELLDRALETVRSRLDNIPRSLPARLAHQDEPACQEILEKAITECIESLHRVGKRYESGNPTSH